MSNFHAALEIGTSRTVLAIGETSQAGRLKVIAHAEIPSTGIRKSQILDISQASQSIRAVLHEIEKKQLEGGIKISIGNALLAVSGQHIHADHAEGLAQIDGNRVTEKEINEARLRSREMPLAKGRELLDIVDQSFTLDSIGGIVDPTGMAGRILKLNSLHIHADKDRLTDARTAAEDAHLEIREPVFSTTCAADAVLEDYERKNGALVLDLGGGSTGYAVYCDDMLVTTGVLGVGGDHITNDIAHAFQTTNAQAEDLKVKEGSAMMHEYESDNLRVHINASSSLMDARTISRRSLDTVINARAKEILSIIRDKLEDEDLLHRLHSGCILTGGGASLDEIDALAEQTLGVSVRRARPIHVDGLENAEAPWSYASIAGTLLYSQRNFEEKSVFGNLFGRFFK